MTRLAVSSPIMPITQLNVEDKQLLSSPSKGATPKIESFQVCINFIFVVPGPPFTLPCTLPCPHQAVMSIPHIFKF